VTKPITAAVSDERSRSRMRRSLRPRLRDPSDFLLDIWKKKKKKTLALRKKLKAKDGVVSHRRRAADRRALVSNVIRMDSGGFKSFFASRIPDTTSTHSELLHVQIRREKKSFWTEPTRQHANPKTLCIDPMMSSGGPLLNWI